MLAGMHETASDRDGGASSPDADFEALFGELSARFVALPPGKVDDEFAGALRLVTEWFQTDNCLFLEFTDDFARLTVRHAWTRPGIAQPVPPTLAHQVIPWAVGEFRHGRRVVLGTLPDDLPDGELEDREYVSRAGLLATVGVPVVVGDNSICVLSTSDVGRHRVWTPRDVDRLQLIANILGGAFQRQRTDEELRARIAEIGSLRTRLEHENVYLREEIKATHDFAEIIGHSAPLRAALAQVARVAPTGAAVLLQGETGTGKELLARAIHARSPRQRQPMIKVDCSAIPPTLIESELFGHEKGAFTGAVSTRVSRFEVAHGGTLFLDEIGELPIELQPKLLRLLQDGEFERVGSNRTIKVDVRVIAATHRDLAVASQDGSFRQDLYYRLSVFPIEVPPLRARRDDIPLLVWGIINRRQDQLQRKIARVRRPDMDALQAYDWPGNVRELQNVIERALILTTGDILQLDGAFTSVPAEGMHRHESQRLDVVERDHIVEVLEQCGWRINGTGHAADVLGLKPNTLRFRMKRLSIVRPPRQ
jgi:transcriptional regulator with GAF, ATPase, and Fis domain